jgi:hypothetical protein
MSTLLERVSLEISAGRLSSDFIVRLKSLEYSLPSTLQSRIEAIVNNSAPDLVKNPVPQLIRLAPLPLAPDSINHTLKRPVTSNALPSTCLTCFLNSCYTDALNLDSSLIPGSAESLGMLNPRLSLALVDTFKPASSLGSTRHIQDIGRPIYDVIADALTSENTLTELLKDAGLLNEHENWQFGKLSKEVVKSLFMAAKKLGSAGEGGHGKAGVHKFLTELGRMLGGRTHDSVLWEIVWKFRGWEGMPVLKNNVLYDVKRPWTRATVEEWLKMKAGGRRCNEHVGEACEDGGGRLHSEDALELVITRFVVQRGLHSPYELI